MSVCSNICLKDCCEGSGLSTRKSFLGFRPFFIIQNSVVELFIKSQKWCDDAEKVISNSQKWCDDAEKMISNSQNAGKRMRQKMKGLKGAAEDQRVLLQIDTDATSIEDYLDDDDTDVEPTGSPPQPNTAALWSLTMLIGIPWILVDRIITLRGVQNRSQNAQRHLFRPVVPSRFGSADKL